MSTLSRLETSLESSLLVQPPRGVQALITSAQYFLSCYSGRVGSYVHPFVYLMLAGRPDKRC